MREVTAGRLARSLLLAAAGVGTAAGIADVLAHIAVSGWIAATRPAIADPADVLLAAIAGVGAVLAAWLGVATATAALAELPGSLGRTGAALSRRLAPAAVRRLVAFLVGTVVVAAVAPGTAAGAAYPPMATRPATTAEPNPLPNPLPNPTPGAPTTGEPTPAVPAPAPGFGPVPAPGGGAPADPAGTAGPAPTTRRTPTSTGATTPDPGFRPISVVAVSATPTPTVSGVGPSSSTGSTGPGSSPGPPAPSDPSPPVATVSGVTTTPSTTSAPTTTTGLGPLGSAPRTGPESVQVVVRRGDSLWSIAARQLGPGADAAQIAAAWPRWYAANRTVIGPDPDHIRPGQVLVPPTGAGS